MLTTLHSFHVFPNGETPRAGLVQGSDGNFYGATTGGGTNSSGTVFKISTNGALTTLYSFAGNDGANPEAGLVEAGDGNFYGTTYSGGTVSYPGNGTVFRISTNSALTSLYSFTGSNDGAYPAAALVQGNDGYFYGTTSGGGTNNSGTVFKISTNGALTSLYSFTGSNDGAYPAAALVQGNDGYFYGTTSGGGTNNSGTVFKISTNGALTGLYSFTGSNDGASPNGLVQASDGNFYGTTEAGGNFFTNYYDLMPISLGTVFKISTNGALTSLYSFGGVDDDDENPQAGLVQGTDGMLYGTTSRGGMSGDGTVFRVSTSGALTTLYSFGGNDGGDPQAGLVQGRDGNFYGTTSYGGTNNSGTVFKIGATGALTSLYSFTPVIDGGQPFAGLAQGSDDSFYGTTSGYDGTASTVFKISAAGALTTLYSFTGTNDGWTPAFGLVQGDDGNLYGQTSWGGTNDWGTIFRITTNGAFTNLYSFTGGNDGANPRGPLVQGSDGNFYGMTYGGGTSNSGTVFRISANGALTSLYSFTGGNDGANPTAGLVEGSDGNFYGATYYAEFSNDPFAYGTIFKISTDGVLTTLYSFVGNDGGNPFSTLVQGSDGSLYGTTYGGGTHGWGTVFKISTTGAYTTLYSLTGGNGGANPNGPLAQGSDGSFYGTTQNGGGPYSGTLFKISTTGAYTRLYSFTGDNDGWDPQAGLVEGSDDSFYGTTQNGGVGGGGTVFRLTVVPTAPEFQALTLTNGAPSLTWSTEAGSRYQLQYNSDLTSSNWINLNSPVTATGASLTTTDSVTNAPQRFYRLAISP